MVAIILQYDAPILVAARSKAWICGRSLAVFAVSVVCCQVEVSAMGRSLVQRSCTECSLSEYDREALIMRRPMPTTVVKRCKKCMICG